MGRLQEAHSSRMGRKEENGDKQLVEGGGWDGGAAGRRTGGGEERQRRCGSLTSLVLVFTISTCFPRLC
ncbi:hypothetical protein E2C01_069184 [Portunus trituberculatus]|uniref:Uncharacterized protein n=1 Tax=Portunus trituberculatus TaxID=210409 RepID=A0A5B7I1H9_PORTR|nr:hypothetical protein [Portunus trituberculatus]